MRHRPDRGSTLRTIIGGLKSRPKRWKARREIGDRETGAAFRIARRCGPLRCCADRIVRSRPCRRRRRRWQNSRPAGLAPSIRAQKTGSPSTRGQHIQTIAPEGSMSAEILPLPIMAASSEGRIVIHRAPVGRRAAPQGRRARRGPLQVRKNPPPWRRKVRFRPENHSRPERYRPRWPQHRCGRRRS